MINCTGGALTLDYLYSNDALNLMSFPLTFFIIIGSVVLFFLALGGLIYLIYLWTQKKDRLDYIEERINDIEYTLRKRKR